MIQFSVVHRGWCTRIAPEISAGLVCSPASPSQHASSIQFSKLIGTFLVVLAVALLVGVTDSRADADLTWTNTAAAGIWETDFAWTTNLYYFHNTNTNVGSSCQLTNTFGDDGVRSNICGTSGAGTYPKTIFESAYYTNASTYTVRITTDNFCNSNVFQNPKETEATITLDSGNFQLIANGQTIIAASQSSTTTVYLTTGRNTNDVNAGYSSGGTFVIGRNGRGTLIITNGTLLASGNVNLGTGSNGVGRLIITGTNSLVHCTSQSGIGGSTNSPGGSSVIVSNGAMFRVDSSFRLGSVSGQGCSSNFMILFPGSKFASDVGPQVIGARVTSTNPPSICNDNFAIVKSGAVWHAGYTTFRSFIIGNAGFIPGVSNAFSGNLATNNSLTIEAGGVISNVSNMTITPTNSFNLLRGYASITLITNYGLVQAYGGSNITINSIGTPLGGINVTDGGHLGGFIVTNGGTLWVRSTLSQFGINNGLLVDEVSGLKFDLGTNFNSTYVGLNVTSNGVVLTANGTNNMMRIRGTWDFADGGGFAATTYDLINYNTNFIAIGSNNVFVTLPATIGETPDPDCTYTINTNTLGIIKLIVECPPRITSITRQGSNVVLTWRTSGAGTTNTVQVTPGTPPAVGNYTNNFVNLSSAMIVTSPFTNFTDVGGATNVPARYYRIRSGP